MGAYIPSATGSTENTHGNKILICPARRESNPYSTYGPVVGTYNFYGMCAGGIRSASGNPARLAKDGEIKNPSVVPYWVEVANLTSYGIAPGAAIAPHNISAVIHTGRSNVLFVDGHTTSISGTTWLLNSPSGLDSWAWNFALAYDKPNWSSR